VQLSTMHWAHENRRQNWPTAEWRCGIILNEMHVENTLLGWNL